MRNLNKIRLFVIVCLVIVCVSISASFIWMWSSSSAKPVYINESTGNINNEINTDNLNEEVVVKVEEDTNKTQTEKEETITDDSGGNQNKNEVNNETQKNQPENEENNKTNNEKEQQKTESKVENNNVVKPTFKEVNEKVYATLNVNIRTEPDVSSQSIGVLKTGEEITRTGIGSNGWDRVIYNNSTRYICHKYLSTQKVVVSEKSVSVSTVNPTTQNNATVTTTKETTKESTSKQSTSSTTSTNQYSEEWVKEFNNKIISLQKEFPSGYYWNHMGSTVNGNYVTTTPCNNKKNGNKYCNEYQGKSTIACGFSIGRQCAGFASMLSDRVFGKNASAIIFYNYDDIRIGDQARINNNSHTVFIIEKTDDYVVVAECNADYNTCVINWGRKIPRSQLKGFYITRR